MTTVTTPWPPPQTEEHPSRCDFCPRRDVVVLDVACLREHLGEVIVCRDRHEPDARNGDIYCKPCEQAHHTSMLTVTGVSEKLPEPRP